MRRLKAMAAPFEDAKGEQIYDGNYMRPSGAFSLFSRKAVYERGKWWLYDLMPFYIEQSNRYKPLTREVASHYYISDDRIELK